MTEKQLYKLLKTQIHNFMHTADSLIQDIFDFFFQHSHLSSTCLTFHKTLYWTLMSLYIHWHGTNFFVF